MEKSIYRVEVNWDTEASVWVATSEDIPGLATEDESLESLTKKLHIMIPELLQFSLPHTMDPAKVVELFGTLAK